MKHCNVCKLTKELSEFHKNAYNPSGLCAACKPCRNRLRRESKVAKEYTKKTWKNRDLLRKFNITEEQYTQMLLLQNNKCKICQVDASQLERRLAVDHCHVHGNIRGLLCRDCNVALGLFKDSKEVISKATQYLVESSVK